MNARYWFGGIFCTENHLFSRGPPYTYTPYIPYTYTNTLYSIFTYINGWFWLDQCREIYNSSHGSVMGTAGQQPSQEKNSEKNFMGPRNLQQDPVNGPLNLGI